MNDQANEMVVLQVDFQVPRKVRATLEEDAKEIGVTVERHTRNQLCPLVPDLLRLWTGHVDRPAA